MEDDYLIMDDDYLKLDSNEIIERVRCRMGVVDPIIQVTIEEIVEQVNRRVQFPISRDRMD